MLEVALPKANGGTILAAPRPKNLENPARSSPRFFNILSGGSTFLAHTFVASAIVFAAIEPGWPGMIMAAVALGGLAFNYWSAAKKERKSEQKEIERHAETRLELVYVKDRCTELQSQLTEVRKELKDTKAETKHDIEVKDAQIKELRDRLSTHVSLITEIAIRLKDGDGGRAHIEGLIVAWQKRETWLRGDTP